VNEFDDLNALTPGPVERFAFWTCVAMMLMLAIGTVSFGTGLLWDGYIHPAIVKVLIWFIGMWP
jgi:hypothetical protein